MCYDVNKKINDLKVDASELINKAGFAIRKSKGFPEAVEVIQTMIECIDHINYRINEIERSRNDS